ncbi:MAG TPA: hypothetical protein VK858_08410 [Longimicrobiales bacterium]|nr:hypothetical protein [Longimicrobiales bacterium]
MTRDEFEARYELIEQVTEGEIESHHALHHSGVVVMVHLVSGTEAFQDQVEQAVFEVGGSPPEGQVLEVHRLGDRRAIVTRFLMDFVSIQRWVGMDGAAAPGDADPPGAETPGPSPVHHAPDAPEGPEPVADAPPEGAGEFTRMFQAATPPAPPTSDGPPLPPVSDAPPAPPRPDLSAAPPPPDVPEAPPPSMPAGEGDAGRSWPGEQGAGGGEFTRMFSRPEQEPAPPPAPPPPPSAEPDATPPAADGAPGEFTRMFRPPSMTPPAEGTGPDHPPGAAAPPPPPPPATPDATPPATGGAPGEFTRMFRPPSAPTPPAGGTDAPPPPETPAPPPPPPSAGPLQGSAPPAQDGPGEFTRFFAAHDAGPDLPDPDAMAPTRKTPRVVPPEEPAADSSWADALRTPRREPPPQTGDVGPAPAAGPKPEAPPPAEGGFTQMFGAQKRPAVPANPSPPPAGGAPPPPPPSEPGAAQPPKAPGHPPKVPGMPRGRAPNLDAMLRRPRVPRPRAPAVVRAPTPRNIVRAAAGAVQAAGQMKGGAGGGEDGAQAPGKKTPRAVIIGLVALIVITAGLLIFFALWDFAPNDAGGDTTVDPVAAPAADPGG